MSELPAKIRGMYHVSKTDLEFVRREALKLCDEHERLEAAIRGDQGEPRAILTVNVLRWPAEERIAFARHLLGSEWKSPEHERLEAEVARLETVVLERNAWIERLLIEKAEALTEKIRAFNEHARVGRGLAKEKA